MARSIAISLGGGNPGFAEVIDVSRLRLAVSDLDSPELAGEGQGFGALFLIPTLGETLRVNGRVTAINRDTIEITVEECYVHCAKALIRSEFWMALPLPAAPFEPADFLASSRLLVLATIDTEARADVSPKGDPAGRLIQLRNGAACFADRPGNRRADSFRNILMQPRIAIAALLPGSTRIALLTGEAHMTREADARASFAVGEKTPLLVTRIEKHQVVLFDSPTLARAAPWPATAPDADIDPATIIAGHVKLSKERGIGAIVTRAAVAIPGLMRQGLARDYKTNLY